MLAAFHISRECMIWKATHIYVSLHIEPVIAVYVCVLIIHESLSNRAACRDVVSKAKARVPCGSGVIQLQASWAQAFLFSDVPHLHTHSLVIPRPCLQARTVYSALKKTNTLANMCLAEINNTQTSCHVNTKKNLFVFWFLQYSSLNVKNIYILNYGIYFMPIFDVM